MSPIKPPSFFTRFPPLLSESHNEGESSPRTKVAGEFQELHISNYALDQLHDGGDGEHDLDVRPNKRAHYGDEDDDKEMMESSQDPRGNENERTARQQQHRQQQQTDGPTDAPQPLPPSSHNQLPIPPSQPFTFSRAMSTVFSPSQGQETPRPKSPSLKSGSGEVSDQYWHESEITGHDPDDPDDDGYGINGIGFKPTSAMAAARTQRRRQQIAEYRSREAKEARQRRSERRRVGSGEIGVGVSEMPAGTPEKRGVRFSEEGE